MIHKLDAKPIREWLILGPFFPDDLGRDFLADSGGEANVVPKQGDTVTTTDGRTLTWKRYQSDRDIINLLDAVGNHQQATAYAFCTLQCETGYEMTVGMRHDDGIIVWMNGKKVYSNPVLRGLAFFEDQFGAELEPGNSHCLIKVSQQVNQWGFGMRIFPPDCGVISGIVMDETGKPIPNANVHLEQDGKEIAKGTTDDAGSYRLTIHPAGGTYDLSATSGNMGHWQVSIPLTAGERRRLNLTLRKAISIEGMLLMLDDATPHVAVVVQAVIPPPDGAGEPVVVEGTLSDEAGRYQLINLRPGTYQVRCTTPGEYLYYGAQSPEFEGALLTVASGKTLCNIDFRFAPIKKGTWRHYSGVDGLPMNAVNTIAVDSDGFLWLGTDGGGVSRFDGKTFTNFSDADGLPYTSVIYSVHPDAAGALWCSVWGGRGVYRYDGQRFAHFGEGVEGLGNAWNIYAINSDLNGALWFGTTGGNVFRYDARGMSGLVEDKGVGDSTDVARFITRAGDAGGRVVAAHESPDGMMWFATANGISRYDGKGFTYFTHRDALINHSEAFANLSNERSRGIGRDANGGLWWSSGTGKVSVVYPENRHGDGKRVVDFTPKDGFPPEYLGGLSYLMSMASRADSTVWFGIWGEGISRYDGVGFVNWTRHDGLLSHAVKKLYMDPDGVLWIGSGSGVQQSERGGLSRYDPSGVVQFDTRDGLPGSPISALHRSPDGVLWISTFGEGVYRYDGRAFEGFTTEDGLASNYATTIEPDDAGVLWFGSGGFYMPGTGVSRYDIRTGKFLKPLTVQDGLVSNTVYCIYAAPDGVVWLGTNAGISRYHTQSGEFLKTLTTEDGLADNWVMGIHCDPTGVVWLTSISGRNATTANVTCYDGKAFVKLGSEEGRRLLMQAFHGDENKVVWDRRGLGARLSRYDGVEGVQLTQKDGLADNLVRAIWTATNGVGVTASGEMVWFGTNSKGVSFYDGIARSSLDTRDGLAGDTITAIAQDADGSLWFGTQEGGLTRYRRTSSKPKATITSVTTDETYRDLSALPPMVAGKRVTIEYNAIDFKTIPEKRQYRVRIQASGRSLSKEGIEADWGKPTKETTFDWFCKKPGTYTFQVQAIDRDLNYSEPASLNLTVQGDPRLVALQTEVEQLRQEVGEKYHFTTIIGESIRIRKVKALMERAIDSDLTVLIVGETGTGKELVAKAIHHNSKRKAYPLLDLNCGAVPKELLASKLFGHRKGAFTGAYEDQTGLFEAASGGSVLLDEVGEMSQDAQIQLLRVLEERQIQRLGEHTSHKVDVRVIAMTNRDLLKEVDAGRFREDLYYRLSVFPIRIPPLRERPEDIPLLAEHFLKEMDNGSEGFAPGVLEMLQGYSWPGNVRELRNAVHRAAALALEGQPLQSHHFSIQISQNEALIREIISQDSGLSASVEQLQRRLVENALQQCDGNRTQAAKMLRVDRANLVRLMKRLGIEW